MGTLFEVDGTSGVVSFRKKGTSQLVLEQGTSEPASPGTGQVFYRTDLNLLEIFNGTNWYSVSSGSYRVYDETPSGTVNGSNTVFTTANPYVAGTTQLTRDGLMLKPGGVDYTETTPGSGTLTFTTAPTTGSTIMVSYSRLETTALFPYLNKVSYVVGTPSGPYTGSTTVFNLGLAYVPGSGSLIVISGGVVMLAGTDYTETNTSTVTFGTARTTGEVMQFIKLGAANDSFTSGWQKISSNTILQSSTDSVGIGTASPSYKLHVSYTDATKSQLQLEQLGTGDSCIHFSTTGGSAQIGYVSAGGFWGIGTGPDLGTSQIFRYFTGSNQARFDPATFLVAATSSSQFTNTLSVSGSGGFLSPAPNTLDDGGSFGANIRTVTTSTSATTTDYTILVDTTTGAITITLPAASGCTRRIYNIKKIDSTVNTVTVDANASETIDGALTKVLSAQWQTVTIQSNGTSWFVL